MAAKVSKNAFRATYLKAKSRTDADQIIEIGRNQFEHLLTEVGGASIGILFSSSSPGDRTIMDYEIKYHHILAYPETFQIWANIPNKRRYSDLLKSKKNKAIQQALFNRIALELWGDASSMLLLQTAYKSISPTKPCDEDADCLEAQRKAEKFHIDFDGGCEKAIVDSIGTFVSLQQEILTQKWMHKMTVRFKEDLPDEFKKIWDQFDFDRQVTKNGILQEHRTAQYERRVFWNYISMRRQKNPSNHLAMANIVGASQMASSASESVRKPSVFFGAAAAKQTVEQRLYKYHEEHFKKNMEASLADSYFYLFPFDNWQKGKNKKFQEQGSSNDFRKGTAGMFVKPVTPPTWTEPLPENAKVKITYVNQAVPAPYGMFPFERLVGNTLTVADRTSLFLQTGLKLQGQTEMADQRTAMVDERIQGASQFDFSGKRVNAYSDLLDVSESLIMIHRHLSTGKRPAFLPDTFGGGEFENSVMSSLSQCRKREGIYNVARNIQAWTVKDWRPGHGAIGEVLLLPVRDLDETTNLGAGTFLLEGFTFKIYLNTIIRFKYQQLRYLFELS
jgi:hypothetical protein